MMSKLSYRATLISGLVALGLPLLLGACGQVGDVEPPVATPGGVVETPESDAAATSTAQPDGSWTDMELAVLEALSDDPASKEARYEADADRIVVTVHADGESLSDERLRDLQERAEEVTNGTPVVVETTDEDVPTED